jgi:hypothetical protein
MGRVCVHGAWGGRLLNARWLGMDHQKREKVFKGEMGKIETFIFCLVPGLED